MRVIFDVDGTLIQSVAVDAELYDRAFRDTFGVPLPTTDWSDIIARAIELAGGDGDVFYVGDGAWDVQASRALGIGFIGVDSDGGGRLGVPAVSDFADVDAFVRRLCR